MPRRNKKILFASLLFVLVCLYGLHIVVFNRVETLSLGHGRWITFYNNQYEIDSCAREFQVRDYFGRVVNNGCFVEFCDEPSPNKYKIVTSENGNVIGVLDSELYNPLFVMCDFSSGTCSPCNTSDLEKQEMFEKLKKENPELPELDKELPPPN